MKIIHAVIALLLSALLLAIVSGMATASVTGAANNVPALAGQGPITSIVTHRDISTPSTYHASPTTIRIPVGTIKPSVTVMPTKVKRYSKVGGGDMRIKPSVTVMPTKVKRYSKVGGGELRIKPSPTAKYVQLFGKKSTPVPTVKVTTSPAKSVASPAKTPAQSYGIYGLGGDTPYFNKTTPSSIPRRTSTQGSSGKVSLSSDSRNAGRGPGFGSSYAGQVTVTPTKFTVPYVPKISINPTASPTPVPGGYTPRFPGEPGYKGSPTPTVKATVTAKPVARR